MFFRKKNKEKSVSETLTLNQNVFAEMGSAESVVDYVEAITFEDLQNKVRELAYKKWEDADRPWGRDEEFWTEAETELFGESSFKDGGYEIKINNQTVSVTPNS